MKGTGAGLGLPPRLDKPMRTLLLPAIWIPVLLLLFCSRVSAQQHIAPDPNVPATRTPTSGDRWIQHYIDRVEQFKAENAGLERGERYFVFVGDSITEMFPLAEHFPDKPVLNRGITSDGIGMDVRGVLNRMNESIFDCSPAVVFLLIGVNDLPHEGKTPQSCFDAYRRIVDEIQAKLPAVKLVLQTCLPTGESYKRHAYLNPRIEEYNTKIRELAKERELPLIDLHPLYRDEQGLLRSEMTRDGLHIKKECYGAWAEKVKAFLE